MDQKEQLVSRTQTEQAEAPARGPVELDPSLFGFVSGGAVFTWGNSGTSQTQSSTAS